MPGTPPPPPPDPRGKRTLGDEWRDAEKLVNSISHWLLEAGFLLASHRAGLAFGGQIWRFTSPHIDIELIYEARDGLVITAGGVGQPTFTYEVWAMLLNIAHQPFADAAEEWESFKSNIELFDQFAASNHEGLTGQLRRINLGLVGERIGLPPGLE